jgi:hypothetical protein
MQTVMQAAPAAQLSPAVPWRRLGTPALLVLLAALLTLCNCIKPIHMDDAAYVAYAAHIDEYPLKPYDFQLYWDYQMHPANQVLAPPVLLYWIAGAMRYLGDEPWLWKLSLLPLHVLLVFSLFVLLRRFAGSSAMPLVWMLVLSPALLPATNLMLDVPALALSAAAVALFLRAADRRSWRLAAAAGLISGLAMQTKYTAVVTPAVMLAYGLTHRRLRLALLPAAVSAAMFVVWEVLVYWQQGSSHFVHALENRPGSMLSRMQHLLSPLFTMTASLAPGTLLVALYGWTRSWKWLAAGVLALIAGVAAMGIIPPSVLVLIRDPSGRPHIYPESMLYSILTIAWWIGLGLVVARLWALPSRLGKSECHRQQRPVVMFLLLWLGLETLGYFMLSPFPAARRLLGVVMVATLLVGSYTSLTLGLKRNCLWLATLFSAALGLFVAWIDVLEADATRAAAERTAEVARPYATNNTAWFSATWGYQFYAVQHHLQPLIPYQSQLKRGDWLILAEQPLWRVNFHTESAPLELREIITVEDGLPWQTVLCYYCGRAPLHHDEGPRIRVTIYRVLEDFVPTAKGVLPPLR